MADNQNLESTEEPTYRLTNDSEEPATKADIERLRSELNTGLSLKASQHDFDYIVGNGKQGWTITDYIIRLEEQWHEAMALMASKEDLADNSTTDQTKLKKLIMINESSSSDTKLALNTSGSEEIELATMDDFDKLESYFTFDWEGTWERGGINASGATEESTSILRTASYIPSRDFTATLDNAYSFQVVRYDENKKFIKKDNWVIGSNRLQYTTKDIAGTKYVKFLIKKNDGSNLTDVNLPKSILSVSMNGTDFTGKNNNIAMDPSVLNDVVQVSETQPTSAINEIWVKPQGSEVEIPTMEEFEEVRDDVEELKSDTDYMISYIDGEHVFSSFDFEQGSYSNAGNKMNNTNRIRSAYRIPVGEKMAISFTPGVKCEWALLKVVSDSNEVIESHNLTSSGTYSFKNRGRLLIVLRNSSEIAVNPSDFDCEMSIYLVLTSSSVLRGKKISIYGDSISTYAGYIPQGNASYYKGNNAGVTAVTQTWWWKTIEALNLDLLVNNSWSGRTVSSVLDSQSGHETNAGYKLDNILQLANNGVFPEIIIIKLGINDFNNECPLGTYDGKSILPSDPSTFTNAYAIMLDLIMKNFPLARVYCCTLMQCERNNPIGFPEINGNNESLTEWNESIKKLAKAFGAEVLDHDTCGISYYNLSAYMGDYNIESSQGLHPNAAGHTLIANKTIDQMDNAIRIRY